MKLLFGFVLLESGLADTIKKINDFFSSNILMYGLLFAGLFLSILLGFPQVTKIG